MEETTIGWVIHGGNDSDSQSFFSRDTSDYERLCNLDVLAPGTEVRMTSLMSTQSSKRT